ncbi:MAG: RNA methyltransferase [Oscillospiraceae bacterium]
MENITSKDNKFIKEYIKLSTKKAYRDEQQKFVIESVKLYKEAVATNTKIEKVFVTEQCIEKYFNESEKSFQADKTYIISQEISNKMSELPSSQGIFAILKKPDFLNFTAIKNGKYIVLCDVQDPGNIGTIVRTADAFGLDGVVLAGNSCDIYNIKTIRSTMGSLFRVKIFITNSCMDVVNHFNGNNIITCAAVLDKLAKDISKYKFPNNCAVLIGNEGNGLSQQISDICSEKITIKMAGNAESLNASMAAGILMWELTK